MRSVPAWQRGPWVGFWFDQGSERGDAEGWCPPEGTFRPRRVAFFSRSISNLTKIVQVLCQIKKARCINILQALLVLKYLKRVRFSDSDVGITIIGPEQLFGKSP
jgi:hypothetical protein